MVFFFNIQVHTEKKMTLLVHLAKLFFILLNRVFCVFFPQFHYFDLVCWRKQSDFCEKFEVALDLAGSENLF